MWPKWKLFYMRKSSVQRDEIFYTRTLHEMLPDHDGTLFPGTLYHSQESTGTFCFDNFTMSRTQC